MNTTKEKPLFLAVIAGVGMFLSTLDSGIINIAIPSLMREFHRPMETVIWTVTFYTLILSATILLFGRLADRIGRLKIYTAGLGLFAISSLLCGSANNIYLLILFRGVQGLSAAMLQATAIALITTRLTEHNTTKALGVLGMLLGLGPMMGPVVGGFILSTIGWRWIFWINIPVCLLGLIGCKKLPKIIENLHGKPIYYKNLFILAINIMAILLTMSFCGNNRAIAYTMLFLSIILFFIYFRCESKSQHPIIPFHLFKSIKFTAPMLGAFALGGTISIVFILPPIYLEEIRLLEPWQVGILCLSAPIGSIAASQIVTRMIIRIGARPPMIMGFSILLMSLILLSCITPEWPLYRLFILLLCCGIGGGLFQIPCYINLTKQFQKEQQAFISALTRMIQNLGIVISASTISMLISIFTKTDLITGIHYGWFFAIILCSLALLGILATFLSERKNHVFS